MWRSRLPAVLLLDLASSPNTLHGVDSKLLVSLGPERPRVPPGVGSRRQIQRDDGFGHIVVH